MLLVLRRLGSLFRFSSYSTADCCVNIDDGSSTSGKNVVAKFGPVTPEILWLICMGVELCADFKAIR